MYGEYQRIERAFGPLYNVLLNRSDDRLDLGLRVPGLLLSLLTAPRIERSCGIDDADEESFGIDPPIIPFSNISHLVQVNWRDLVSHWFE